MKQQTKLVVNLDAFHHNIRRILGYKTGMFLFVLKGNAYGHGYLPIVRELEEYERIPFIGVALPSEALYLSTFTKKKIVIMGYTPDEQIQEVIQHNIIPTIFEYSQAQLIATNTDVFVNIDTGFHRLGGKPEESFTKEIQKIQKIEHVHVLGVFTHLALRNSQEDVESIKQFTELTKALDIPYTSISDSIAYTRYDTSENLYRIGAAMFGLTSVKEAGKLDLKPTTSLYSHVTHIQTMTKDTDVFYRSHVLSGTTIATIQIGYADGLFRTMHPESFVMINNQPCSYIEVGMDQSIVDVTGVAVDVGDSVTIFDASTVPIETLATCCDTNKNNILSLVSQRVKREYWKHGKRISTLDLGGETYE